MALYSMKFKLIFKYLCKVKFETQIQDNASKFKFSTKKWKFGQGKDVKYHLVFYLFIVCFKLMSARNAIRIDSGWSQDYSKFVR